MNKVMMEEWHILSLDVWGNAEDGYEVNDVRKVHEIFIPDNIGGDYIVPMLRRSNLLSDDHLDKDYDVRWDSEGFIELNRSSDGRPLLQIQKAYDGHSYEQ